MAYVDSTWIESEIWSVESWLVFGRSVRINYYAEGWHNRLNRRVKKGNLPFYLLLSPLYSESNQLPTQIKLIKEGKLNAVRLNTPKRFKEG